MELKKNPGLSSHVMLHITTAPLPFRTRLVYSQHAGECKVIIKLAKSTGKIYISILFINFGLSELPLSSFKILVHFHLKPTKLFLSFVFSRINHFMFSPSVPRKRINPINSIKRKKTPLHLHSTPNAQIIGCSKPCL